MYRILGKLEGPLCPFIPTTPPADEVVAVLLGSQGVEALGDDDRNLLRAAFDEHVPVACVHPRPGALQGLMELLSPAEADGVADDDDIEVHVLQREARGLRHARYYAPSPTVTVHEQVERVDRELAPGEEPTPDMTLDEPSDDLLPGVQRDTEVDVPDDDDARRDRVDQLLTDLRVAHPSEAARDVPAVSPEVMMTSDAISGPSKIIDLWRQARHIKSEIKWPYLFTDGSTTRRVYLQTATVAIAARVSKPEPKDYFYIVHYGLFSPSTAFVYNEDKNRGWFVAEYGVDCRPASGVAKDFTLLKTSPDTTADSKSVTSGISYSLSGNVGFFGEAPMGGVNAGATISNSTTMVVRDVTVLNKSADALTNGKWLYQMPKLEARGALKMELTDPVKLSTNTFQPTMYLLWDRSTTKGSKTKSTSFDLELSTKIMHDTLSWHFFWCTIHRRWHSPKRTFSFNVSIPPAPAAGF